MVKAYNVAATEEAKANCKLMLDIWKQSQVENYFRKGLRPEIKQILSSRTGMDTMPKMVAEAAQIEESQEKKTRTNINELDGGSEPEEEEVVQKKPKNKSKAAKKSKTTEEDELSVIDLLNKLWHERKKNQTLERSERRSQYRGNGRGGRGRRGRGGQRSRDSPRERERFECFNCRRLGYHYASDCPEEKYEYPSQRSKTHGINRNNRSRARVKEVDEDSDDGIESLNF